MSYKKHITDTMKRLYNNKYISTTASELPHSLFLAEAFRTRGGTQ